MKSRKFILTFFVLGALGFALVWRIVHGEGVADILTAINVTLLGYHGVNVWQDKILGGKK